MGYCVEADVEAALGRPLPLDKDVSVLIEAASDCIDGFVNTTIVADPVTGLFPGVVVRVAAEVVANVINRPMPNTVDMPDPYNAPAFQYHIGPQSIGPWLNQSQQNRLDVLRVHLRTMEVSGETTGYFTRYGIGDISTSTEAVGMEIPPGS